MSDDIDRSNPLDQSIQNLEELLKDTENDLNETMKELQEAEEAGNIEAFLASRNKKVSK